MFPNRAIGFVILCLLATFAIISPAAAQTENLKLAPWWYFQERIEEFFAGSGSGPIEGGTNSEEGEPPSDVTVTETDKEWIVEICGITNPLRPSEKICFKLYIAKKTGSVRIVVKNLIPVLQLTYHIKCKKDGTCEIVDDFWPGSFGTRFCTIFRTASGRIVAVCRFSYLGIDGNSTIQLYFEDGQLCLKVDEGEPSCRPFAQDIPPWMQEIWHDVNPPWLPPIPTEPMGPPAPERQKDPLTQRDMR